MVSEVLQLKLLNLIPMRKALVKLDLKKKSASVKVTFGQQVIDDINTNPNFVSPLPALADMQTVVAELSAAVSAALAGGLMLTSAKNDAERAFDEMFTACGKYVDSIAMGDETIIRSAGIDVRFASVPIGVPSQPLDLRAVFFNRDSHGRVSPLAEGSIKLRWPKVRGANFYNVYISSDGGVNYTLADQTTRAGFLSTALTPGQSYGLYVVAFGAAGASPASVPVAVKAAV